MKKVVAITRLKQQYKVTLDSGDKLLVSEDVLVRFRLLKGTELKDSDIEKIKRASSYDVYYQKTLNYLSYQLRSEKEIVMYLKKDAVDQATIQAIIKKLKELKLLDDQVFSESYVRTIIKTSDKGPFVLKQQLMKKGIAEETILNALLLYPIDEQIKIAKKVAEKSLKKYAQKSHKDSLNKIHQLLMTKGFSTEVIQEVFAIIAIEKDEDKELELIQQQGDKLWERNRKLIASKRKSKVIQALFQKGFDYDLIKQYMNKKEIEDE